MAIEYQNEVAPVKRTLGVLMSSGQVYRVDFTEYPQLPDPDKINWELSQSKLIVGKIQNSRTRTVTLQELELENVIHTGEIPAGETLDTVVKIAYTLDGHTNEALYTPALLRGSGEYQKYGARITGKNVSIQLSGHFNVNTLIATLVNNGRR